jgi:hypothetical protein
LTGDVVDGGHIVRLGCVDRHRSAQGQVSQARVDLEEGESSGVRAAGIRPISCVQTHAQC